MKKSSHIMVVDDELEMLWLVERTLELEGYGVTIATNGSAALALFREREPDLVILDIMMPGPDGFQVLELIRQRSDVPVLMVTAKHEAASLDKALALGADDYVRKPFRPSELAARVQAKLKRNGITAGQHKAPSQVRQRP